MKKLFLMLAVAFMCCGAANAWEYYYYTPTYYTPVVYQAPVVYNTPVVYNYGYTYPVYGGYGWNPYYRTYQYCRPVYRYGWWW